MLVSLERDRLKSEVTSLKSTLQTVQQATTESTPVPQDTAVANSNLMVRPISVPQTIDLYFGPQSKKTIELPSEPVHNRYCNIEQLPICTHFTRTGGLQCTQCVKAHSYAATSLDLHPNKPVVATGSDDHTWALWTISR